MCHVRVWLEQQQQKKKERERETKCVHLHLSLQLYTGCCSCDYVEFYDGTDAGDPLIASFDACDSPSGYYYAQSGSVFVRFVTDESGTDVGFWVHFYSD